MHRSRQFSIALAAALALLTACAEGDRAGTNTFGPGDSDSNDNGGSDSGTLDGETGLDTSGETEADEGSDDADTGPDPDEGEPVCGDGLVEGEEVCDDGVNNGDYGGCNPGCTGLAPHCGDAIVNGGPEQCDDGNEDSSDGCLADCKVPRTCKQILEHDPAAADGPYEVAPKGPDFPFVTNCDMSTDGGGWTEISLAQLCAGNIDAELTAIDAAGVEGTDAMCRPYTRDGEGAHTYVYDLGFPPGFGEFYLSAYLMRANADAGHKSEIYPADFTQTTWDQAFTANPAVGDVAFGSADDAGPVASYARELAANLACQACETPFPLDATPYAAGSTTTVFRIGWGEAGGEAEGWYPWWSGSIYLR